MRKKKVLSPTEERKLRKFKAKEEEEKLDKIGGESEVEGRRAVQMEEEYKKKEAKKNEEDYLNLLDLNKRRLLTYKEILMVSLHRMVLDIEMPTTYRWGVWFDGKGVMLAIRDPKNILHRRAFRPSLDPVLDRSAIHEFTRWAEEVYDKCEGKTSEIWTPKTKKN